jgi:hypothetical protein
MSQRIAVKSTIRRTGLITGTAAALAIAVTVVAPQTVAAIPTVPSMPTAVPAARQQLADPASVLPRGWQKSTDRAVTVSGDAAGLHVLAAEESDGYSWRTVATLGALGVDTSQWIGQACVTGSGNEAVVVYAPREVTNAGAAQGSLARAAVVNLATGAVAQLGGGFSIAYFDPGCGTGEQAVLTKGGWSGDGANGPATTSLVMVDAQADKIMYSVTLPGQVTSAVPYDGEIAAAAGSGLERVGQDGRSQPLINSSAVPFHLVPDSAGGLGFQTAVGKRVQLRRFDEGHCAVVGSAPAGTVELQQTGGKVWVTGTNVAALHGLPQQWQTAAVSPQSQISTGGALAITDVASVQPTGSTPVSPDAPSSSKIQAQVLSGAHPTESFVVAPAVAPVASDGGGTTAKAQASGGDPATPVSPDRTCAIPLNDPSVQAYQPTFQQVEWAADKAVEGSLNDTRGPGLYGTTLPSYTPQGMFPQVALAGGGTVPAQVLLGVLTQESNLEQASRHVVHGQVSNPLGSDNWYGNWINSGSTNTGQVNWANSDCGYGIAQVTTGMCAANNQNQDPQCENVIPLPYNEQLAIAVDYQANIAAGLQILEQKWNQLQQLGITPNGSVGGPEYIENWYMALWAYNSGLRAIVKNCGSRSFMLP